LRRAGVRASLDAGNERLGSRIALARQAAVPYLLCVGAREAAARAVSVRHAEQREQRSFEQAVAEIGLRCAPPAELGEP
jgi:threonyl-tRNA synthetase